MISNNKNNNCKTKARLSQLFLLNFFVTATKYLYVVIYDREKERVRVKEAEKRCKLQMKCSCVDVYEKKDI